MTRIVSWPLRVILARYFAEWKLQPADWADVEEYANLAFLKINEPGYSRLGKLKDETLKNLGVSLPPKDRPFVVVHSRLPKELPDLLLTREACDSLSFLRLGSLRDQAYKREAIKWQPEYEVGYEIAGELEGPTKWFGEYTRAVVDLRPKKDGASYCSLLLISRKRLRTTPRRILLLVDLGPNPMGLLCGFSDELIELLSPFD
ncbi:MAG: hypothetical protein V1821_00975 [bacterium]